MVGAIMVPPPPGPTIFQSFRRGACPWLDIAAVNNRIAKVFACLTFDSVCLSSYSATRWCICANKRCGPLVAGRAFVLKCRGVSPLGEELRLRLGMKVGAVGIESPPFPFND